MIYAWVNTTVNRATQADAAYDLQEAMLYFEASPPEWSAQPTIVTFDAGFTLEAHEVASLGGPHYTGWARYSRHFTIPKGLEPGESVDVLGVAASPTATSFTSLWWLLTSQVNSSGTGFVDTDRVFETKSCPLDP